MTTTKIIPQEMQQDVFLNNFNQEVKITKKQMSASMDKAFLFQITKE